MVFHGVDLLSVVVKLDGFAMIALATRAGVCRFMGPLRGVHFIVDF